MCDRLIGHEPTDERQPSDLPYWFGGAGGLSHERPPLTASDEELDAYCERLYNEGMAYFEAELAAMKRPRKRRAFSDYTAKNCEESFGGP